MKTIFIFISIIFVNTNLFSQCTKLGEINPTNIVIGWPVIPSYASIGSTYFFAANSDAFGDELWASDGTIMGTRLVKDIENGPASSSPSNFTVFKGKLYFFATNTNTGRELWTSDGTSAGTQIVADYNGTESTQSFIGFSEIIANDSVLLFSNYLPNTGEEFFYYNGLGTPMLLGNILPPDGQYRGIHKVDSLFYFIKQNSLFDNFELYTTKGDPGSTRKRADFAHSGLHLAGVFKVGNNILLQTVISTGSQLYLFNPLTNSLTKIYENLTWRIEDVIVVNNKLYFTYDSKELWVSNGTASGTFLLKKMDPQGGFSSIIKNLFSYQNKLHFLGFGDFPGIYSTDGTVAGTQKRYELISNNWANRTNAWVGGPSNNKSLYVTGQLDFINGVELFKFNQNLTSATLACDIRSSLNHTETYKFSYLTNGVIVYQGKYDSNYLNLYGIGTPTSTKNQIVDLPINIFPTIANDKIHIDNPNGLEFKTKVLDIMGKDQNLNGTDTNSDISVWTLNPGIYLIQIQENKTKNTKTIRFMKY
jgi:ELWxxDGT repeat protein